MNHKLIEKINQLPEELQIKLCIYTWRLYWRNYFPLTAKVPSWYHSKTLIENTIFQSKLKNIHFLHLPFNTLPENKKWIMGCQCDYCSNYKNKKLKRIEYKKQYEDPSYFTSMMPYSSLNINDEYYLNKNVEIYNYDPLCGSVYEYYVNLALRTNNFQLDFDIQT